MELKNIVEELQDKYEFSMDEFMELYTRKLPRTEIAERLNLTQHAVKEIGFAMRIKWPKSKRAKYRVEFLIAMAADAENEAEEIDGIVKENDYLSKKLRATNKALQKAKDEATQLRKEVRVHNRRVNSDDELLSILENAIPTKDTTSVHVSINQKIKNYEDYTSCIMLSDLHCEEVVSPNDVGLSNEYTWEIMGSRLDKVFEEWFSKYRGESRGVVLLGGDLFSGLIHNALENTSKHPIEAVQELAEMLHDYILGASMVFDSIEVYVVNGNHGRISENIKSANKGFDLEYLFGHILKAKLSHKDNIKVSISTTGYVTLSVSKDNKTLLGMHHGDHFRGPTQSDSRYLKVYEAFKHVTKEEVTHVIQGHTHQFSHFNTHKGSYIVNGSLIGGNSYGVTSGFLYLRPSQTLVSFKPSGDVDEVTQVFLDD